RDLDRSRPQSESEAARPRRERAAERADRRDPTFVSATPPAHVSSDEEQSDAFEPAPQTPPQPMPRRQPAPQVAPERPTTPEPTHPSWNYALTGLEPDPASDLARRQGTLQYLQGQQTQLQGLLVTDQTPAHQLYYQQQLLRVQSDINAIMADIAALQAQQASGGTFVAPQLPQQPQQLQPQQLQPQQPPQLQPQPQQQPPLPVYPHAQQIAPHITPGAQATPLVFPQQAGAIQLPPQSPVAMGPIIGELTVPAGMLADHCQQAIASTINSLQQQQGNPAVSPLQIVRSVAQYHSNYLPTPPTFEQVIAKWKSGFQLNDNNTNRFALGLLSRHAQQPLTPAELITLYIVGVKAATLGPLGSDLFNELHSLGRVVKQNIQQKTQTNTGLYVQQQSAIDMQIAQLMVTLGTTAEQTVSMPQTPQSLLASLANLSTGMYIPNHDWDFLFFTWINSYGNPVANQSVEAKHHNVAAALQIPAQNRDAFVNGLTTLMWKNLGLWVWVTDVASGIVPPPVGHPPVSQAVRQRLTSDITQLGSLGSANAVCEAELVQFLRDQFLP
ncbi:MAG: hypothetical protein ACRC9T_03655, partial [Vibrionaceae bacterium]